jgi:cytochrome c-type biogenesis protein CcmE
MARKASPARLVIALSVAAVLAVFLLYTSIAGGGNPSLAPSELAGRTGDVQLAGLVVGPVRGDAHAQGLRFRLEDISGDSKASVVVLYTGSVPDLFKVGRHIVVDGALRKGTFVAEPGSMITKCPSKYSPSRSSGNDY